MKTIGLDISLSVCKGEGYTMMQYDARKKFNINTDYRIFAYYPEYLECEGLKGIMTDALYSYTDLLELYNKDAKGVNSYCGDSLNFDNPDYYDFLHLADTLSSYFGLQ